MSVIWHKVVFDIWQHKGRTLLAVLSITAGVFAIGTIFGMMDQLLSSMDAAHQSVSPSHMNIVLRQLIDEETAKSLERIEGVKGVEPVNIVSLRYKRTPDEDWIAGTLVMRSDYENQKYDHLVLNEGKWPDRNEFGIERLTSQYYGIELGDEIILELEGADRSFPITGKIRHPFVPPPDFGGEAYFFTDALGMARFGIPEGYYVQLLVQVEPYSEDYAKDRAAVIKDQLAKQGIGVGLIIYQKPDEHWARSQLLGLNFVLQLLAVVSLFTSVVIVINTMTAIITQQTDQIGVIKAIGGTSQDILKVYLSGVLIYGILAMILALPLGMFSAFFGAKSLLNFFNIDYEVFRFSQRAVILQILSSILAPLIASLWPVLNGALLSVREAIATYGIGADFGSNRLDQWVEQIGERFLSSPYAIALGNMFRRKGRLVLTQIVLTIAGTMFLMTITLSDSLTFTLDNELNRRAYDIRLLLLGQQRSDQVEAIISNVSGVQEVEPWFTIPGTVVREGERVDDTGGLGAELYGIPLGSTMYNPLIIEGRWLRPDDTGRVAVISRETAEFNHLKVGDVITINLGELGEADWTIVGTYLTITLQPFETDPIYAPEPAVVAMTKKANRATQVVIRTIPKDQDSLAFLMGRIRDDLKERNIRISSFFSRTREDDREFARNQFFILNSMLLGLAAIMGLVGGIGLMGSLFISVVERTREIGVLRAIGAQSSTIMGMFVMEGVLQGLLSWILSVPLAFIIAQPIAKTFGEQVMEVALDFTFAYWAVVAWLFIVLLIAVLAAMMPALSATRISVRESLAYA